MAPHSQNNDSPDPKQVLEGQLRECFGRVVYSHKTHEKCADILLKREAKIKLGQIALSVITTGGLVSVLLGTGTVGTSLTSLFSALLLGLNLYTRNHNLSELVYKHKQAANGIWLIREKYQSLITDLVIGGKSLEVLLRERDVLMADLHSVYSSAPRTTSCAYTKAQKALKYNEDMTFSDAEIDAFLPKELKRSQRASAHENKQDS